MLTIFWGRSMIGSLTWLDYCDGCEWSLEGEGKWHSPPTTGIFDEGMKREWRKPWGKVVGDNATKSARKWKLLTWTWTLQYKTFNGWSMSIIGFERELSISSIPAIWGRWRVWKSPAPNPTSLRTDIRPQSLGQVSRWLTRRLTRL